MENERQEEQANQTHDEIKEQEYKVAAKRKQLEKEQPSGCALFFLSFICVAWLLGKIGLADNGFLTIVLVIILFIAFLFFINADNNAKLDSLREEVKQEQIQKRAIMEQVFQKAREDGFEPTTKVFDPESKFCIAIDEAKKRFMVKNSLDDNFQVYNYSDLVDYELSQDGVTTISGRANDALIGGVLFGTTGAVIGASKSKDIQDYCSSLYIALTISNMSDFRIQIPIISKRVPKSSSEYSYAVERAKEMIALLQIIKHDVEKTASSTTNISEAVEAIKRYKELLDLGIITQEEYETKRKELLNI
ncbi:MAG: SHOCT domain-containing protein [Firmicutes bacterium]|nr:SHOCT domain-containing protein [Bacillota bacterium]